MSVTKSLRSLATEFGVSHETIRPALHATTLAPSGCASAETLIERAKRIEAFHNWQEMGTSHMERDLATSDIDAVNRAHNAPNRVIGDHKSLPTRCGASRAEDG